MSSADSNDGSGSFQEGENLSVLIVTQSILSVSSVVSFLDRRGVTVFTFTDLQLAIESLRRRKPTAVLLSVNFPHPRVELLPTVIQANFGVDCMVFAEAQDRRTMAKLSSCKARFSISNPVSGQIVLLRLRQIQNGAASEDESSGRSSALGGERPEMAPSTIRISTGAKPQGKDIILQRGARSGKNAVFNQRRDTKQIRASIQSGRLTLASSMTDGDEVRRPGGSGSASDQARDNSEERILRRCAREALAEFCETQRVSQDFLSEYSSAWVMKMKAARTNATLVLAIGPTSKEHDPKVMLRSLIASLFSAMRSKNIDPSYESSRLIQVQDYIAVSDALLLSSFFAHSKRYSTDVSVAVFPHGKDAEDFEPQMDPAENGMLSVPIGSLRQNVTPAFDAFLFLPRNQKYVQYLRRGAPMPSQQTSSMVARGLTHFLINQDDASAYARYHALSHIFKKTGS